jgi:hypothetical protein
MSSGKIRISYFLLVSYIISVLLLSLLVALLLSLAGVNRSQCKVDSSKVAVGLNGENVEKLTQQGSSRSKRYAAIDDKYRERMKKLKQYEVRKPEFANVKEIADCSALFETDVNGTLWESQRLPTNIMPKYYELEFYAPIFAAEIYNGEVEIALDITEDVNTFIVHAHLLNVFLPFLRDNTNNLIELQCADYYSYNEYYIVRTKNMVRKSQAPLKLKLYFDGFLDLYESGIFGIHYNEGDEFEGYS